jgi:hypothetical protein
MRKLSASLTVLISLSFATAMEAAQANALCEDSENVCMSKVKVERLYCSKWREDCEKRRAIGRDDLWFRFHYVPKPNPPIVIEKKVSFALP